MIFPNKVQAWGNRKANDEDDRRHRKWFEWKNNFIGRKFELVKVFQFGNISSRNNHQSGVFCAEESLRLWKSVRLINYLFGSNPKYFQRKTFSDQNSAKVWVLEISPTQKWFQFGSRENVQPTQKIISVGTERWKFRKYFSGRIFVWENVCSRKLSTAEIWKVCAQKYFRLCLELFQLCAGSNFQDDRLRTRRRKRGKEWFNLFWFIE